VYGTYGRLPAAVCYIKKIVSLITLSLSSLSLSPLGAPEEGVLSASAENAAVPVVPSRPSSTTHPKAVQATVTCGYIVGWRRWIFGWGNLARDASPTHTWDQIKLLPLVRGCSWFYFIGYLIPRGFLSTFLPISNNVLTHSPHVPLASSHA
jgi:hypothetical protein